MRDLKNEFLRKDGSVFPAHRTPFPNTFFAYTDETMGSGFVNQNILNAHRFIKEELMSPYFAWALALNYSLEDMPALLDMSDESCDFLMINEHVSPPTRNVHHFCDKVGVHPAYLLPVSLDSDYVCHYTILRAVAHIYKDPLMSEKDRSIAKECLERERDKFLKLQTIDHYAFAHLMVSHKQMQAEYGMQARRALNIKDLIEHARLKGYFSYINNNPASNIELGLDVTYAKKVVDLDRLYNSVANRDKENANAIYGALLDVSDLMFGLENGQRIVDKTIDRLLSIEPVDKGYEWKLLTNGNWVITNDNGFSEVVIEKNTYNNHFLLNDIDDQSDLFRHFERGIVSCLCLRQMTNALKDVVTAKESDLSRFDKWRKSEVASSWHIPLLANYALASRALGKTLSLPSPDNVDQSEPSKARHAYAHSFK